MTFSRSFRRPGTYRLGVKGTSISSLPSSTASTVDAPFFFDADVEEDAEGLRASRDSIPAAYLACAERSCWKEEVRCCSSYARRRLCQPLMQLVEKARPTDLVELFFDLNELLHVQVGDVDLSASAPLLRHVQRPSLFTPRVLVLAVHADGTERVWSGVGRRFDGSTVCFV